MENEKLFNVLNESIRKFGIPTVSFILSFYNLLESDLTDHLDHKADIGGTIPEVFKKCEDLIKSHDIDKAIYLLQCDTNYLLADYPDIYKNTKVENRIFEIVQEIFIIDKLTLLDDRNRDGNRVYASGSVIQLFMNYLGYDVKEINTVMQKNRWAISRHKNKILKLDYRHPREVVIFKKHLQSKEKLIDYILTHYER